MKVKRIGERNYLIEYQLEGWILNLHIIKGDRFNYIIDTGLGADCAADAKKLLDAAKPTLIINTHHHWDHIWGNHCYPESLIVAHEQCGKRIREKWSAMKRKNKCFAMGSIEMRLPDVTFNDQLCFPEDEIQLFFSPGHTADAISIYDAREDILNIGDNIGESIEELFPSMEVEYAVFQDTLRMYQQINAMQNVSGHNAVLGSDVFTQMIHEIDKLAIE